MSDDEGGSLAGPALCLVGVVSLTVIVICFMTFASPGFLLYGFFSGEWLIENLAGTPSASTTGDNKIYYGLFRRCHHGQCSSNVVDGTTFGLEVTSVVFQFMAILALPWLKLCFPTNNLPEGWKELTSWNLLKFWNYCFTPFLGFAAIFSLSASIYFYDNYNSKTPYLSTGTSQVCAGLGGGFQLVLAGMITSFFLHRKRQKKSSKSTTESNVQQSISGTISSHLSTVEGFFLFVFTYELSQTKVDTEHQVNETRTEQQQGYAAGGLRRNPQFI